MKRLIISVSLLIISVCICLFSYSQLKSISGELENRLTYCLVNIQSDDAQAVIKNVNDLSKLWERKRIYYKILVDEGFTDEIDSSIGSIEFFTQENKSDELIICINDCLNTLKLILKNEKLSFEAIM